MSRSIVRRSLVLAATLALPLAVGLTPAQAAPVAGLPVQQVATADAASVTNVAWGGRRWGHGGWGHGPRFAGRPGWGYRRGGGALAAGAVGLATGAIIGGALAQPRVYETYPDPVYVEPDYTGSVYAAPSTGADEDYCIRRFRSYDPASGTYLGYDGLRHPCP